MRADRILETVLYVDDLGAAEEFYTRVLGLEVYARSPGRQVFFKLAGQMLLLFNPDATVIPPGPDAKLPVPPHGAHGEGHVCFAASGADIAQWKLRLEAAGVAIEADFHWPSGGRSIYFRDPSGNCLEFAEANIWGFEN
ncbi:MAG: VOC family protein [Hyphomicrobiaceae bacterium]|nr:VOC family protein [Hyphomicrobiaceae bacterium]MCC0007140.1 VOC family protein [Hyphomicrobiaceae bacterium]